ncbi:MAG TPA: BTAD domain-containing putative transcriptional regulator [Gemmatimonadales bacterium]|nr:BTAD domain-containing putative transcriptional regulator [Gemmatimonadales bacterium]
MFRLKLFGGASIESGAGVLAGRSAQRRRLAVLALLAMARGRPLSRDKLIGYLWPESDGEKARRLLSESLYVLRKALGEDALVAAGDELRLDPAVVGCDAAEFADALEAGDLERAVALYTGPFLDGFFLGDALEFERWVDAERDRLAPSYARALQQLAEAAAAKGEARTAADWWRRLAEADPYNAGTAVALMRALDAAGDRAGALQHARIHAALLRAEYDAEPDPEVEALAGRMRATPAARRTPDGDRETDGATGGRGDGATTESPIRFAPSPTLPVAPSLPFVAPSPPPPVAPSGLAPVPSSPGPSHSHPTGVFSSRFRSFLSERRQRRVGPVGVSAAGAVLVTAVVVLWLGARRGETTGAHGRPLPESAAPADRTVLVLPISVRGSGGLAYLGDGMVDLLSTDLGQSGELQSIDANRLLAELGRRPAEALVDPDDARGVAERFGAGLFVLGSVFEIQGRVRITAALYDRTRGGRPVGRADVEGGTAEVLQLVDRLGAALLAALPSAPATPRGRVDLRLLWSNSPETDASGSTSADGRFLSFTDWRTGDLGVRDLVAGTSRRLTRKGSWVESAQYAEYSSLSPDGRSVMYSWFLDNGTYELRIADVASSASRVVLPFTSQGEFYEPREWTPRGDSVLVLVTRADRRKEITLVPVAGGAPRVVRPLGRQWPASVALSPDGRHIAYDYPSSGGTASHDLFIVARSGSMPARAVRHAAHDAVLGWAPDGRSILFWSDRESGGGV